MKKLNISKVILFSSIVGTLVSCKKDENTNIIPAATTTGYTVPTSYNFINVNYSGQTTRLNMMDSLSNYMKNANNGSLLDAAIMKNMFSNTGNPFGNPDLDASGKQLKDKAYALDQAAFDEMFDSLATISQSGTVVGSNGVAGIVTSTTNASKKYLLDANGMEHAQLIKKQLMGSVFYYQAMESYLANLSLDDNSTVVDGQGTAQEHHCDEAFGYLGIPTDFPANTTDVRFWGEYCSELDPAIASSAALMNAFLKLRAAISNKDNTEREMQVIAVREQWERVVAGAAILEMKGAKVDFADDAIRNHVLSEAVGFIKSLKYNSNKKISNAQIETALTLLGSNFYTITSTNIDAAISEINSVYGFNLALF